ncbi:MAG: DUF5410 domain-containing protein [Rickettsia endosymbiont of Oxypoda opaca]|nr:DUF5410 domain-containing protein [Rickettsia endosymbiont of Oxypoda opaca]
MIEKEIINRIIAGEVTENDLIKLKNTFGAKAKERKVFIKVLTANLSDDALHKLNHAVMVNADTLVPNNDPNFVCRTPDTKIFQELLALETTRFGMKAKFDAKGNLEPLKPEDIPPAVLDHYATLQKNFYNKRDSKDSLDSRIAQSINFILYAPIVREDEAYKKLDPLRAAQIEGEIAEPKGKYTKQLIESKVSKKAVRQTNEQMNIKEDSIIDKSIKKLEAKNEISIDDKQRKKIINNLSPLLENISSNNLEKNKAELINKISKELNNKKTLFTKLANFVGIKRYKISTKNLKEIGKEVTNKYKNTEGDEFNISKAMQLEAENIAKELINATGNEYTPANEGLKSISKLKKLLKTLDIPEDKKSKVFIITEELTSYIENSSMLPSAIKEQQKQKRQQSK